MRKGKSLSQAALTVQNQQLDPPCTGIGNWGESHPSAELLYKAALAMDVPMETFMQRLDGEYEEI